MKKLTISLIMLVVITASAPAITVDNSGDPANLAAVKSSVYQTSSTNQTDNPSLPVIASVDCPPEAVHEAESCGENTNDGCLMAPGSEQFESINCGDVVCGTYWANYATRDLDWYQLDLTERGFVRWTGVGEAPTRIWIYNGGAGCDDPVYMASDAAEPEGTASIELELFPGAYWLVVGPDDWYDMPCDGSGDYTNNYVVSVNCELGTPVISVNPETIMAEALQGFSTTETLTVANTGQGRLTFTVQATQDIIVASTDHRHNDIEPYRNDLNLLLSSRKPTQYDEKFSKLLKANDRPDNLDVLAIDCPGDGILESETCGDNTNGGCAMAPGSEAFEPLACNTKICGTVWSDENTRDTDWYLLSLTEPTFFTWEVTGEFPLMTIVLIPGPAGYECDEYEAMLIDIIDPEDVSTNVFSLPAGDYWFWVGPTGWYNMPCDGTGDYGNDYVASITCEPPWMTIDVVNGTIHEGDPAVEISVFLDATDLLPGTYTGDIFLRSNDYTNSLVDVPVIFSVNRFFRYIPGDANMVFGYWPAEISPADVTFLVGYFRLINSSCQFNGFFAAADANGDCKIIGSDVTYLVNYFRQIRPVIQYCPDFPHMPPIEETYPECIIVPPPILSGK